MRQTEVGLKQRILPVVLLLVLALSALVNTEIIAISNPLLATVVSFASILILPGFLLSSLIFERGEMSWPERLPVSFVLGLGLLSPPGLLSLILHSNLTVLGGISVAINLVLGGLYLANMRRARNSVFGPPKNGPKSAEDLNTDQDSLDLDASLNPFLLIAFLLAITVVLYIFLSTMSTWSSGDFWYLDYIRDYFDATHFTVTRIDLRAGWWVLQAMLDRVAGVEPLDAFRFYLPPLLMVVSLLAFYSLARELSKNRNIALLSTLLQVLYCVSSIGSHDWIGQGFFDRIVEDKFLIWLIILPVAILLMLKYLAGGKRKYLAPLGLSVAALGFTHPMGLVQGGLSFASFALVYLLFNWKRDKIIRFVAIFTLLLLFLSIPLVQRQMEGGGAIISGDTTRTTSATFNYATATAEAPIWLDLYRNRLLVFSAVENKYMAHPHLVEHPLIMLAILLTPLLIQYLRKSVAVQFLFSNMAIPLLVLYNPLTASLLGRLITPWMLYRISWSLPVSLTVGLFLYKIVRWAQRSLMRYSFFARRPHLLQVIPVLAVVLVAIPLPGHIADGLGFLRERKEKAMSQSERALLTHLRQHVASDSVIMAESTMTNFYIPAFVSSARVLIGFGSGAPPAAGEDIGRFYQARLVNDSVLDILERWDARYVIIETEHDLAFQFSLLPMIFTRHYRNAEYELYEVASDPGPNHVVAGNTYLIRGEWDEAIAEYEKALVMDPEDTLAYFGLGQVYQAQARREEAQAAYRQAIAACPENILARISLAGIYAAEGKTEEATSRYQEAIRLRPDYLASFEALGDLYRAQGEDGEAFRQYEKAIEFPPETGDHHLALGDLCWVKGLPERAVAEYKEAIAFDPRSGRTAGVYMGLGNAYQVGGKLDDAIAVYQKAITLAPDNEYGYTRLGSLYLAEGNVEKAIALYWDAARRNFNSAWPHIELGKIYLRRGIGSVSDETN
jgi:tetratricopeptide (TPR) repeat protein